MARAVAGAVFRPVPSLPPSIFTLISPPSHTPSPLLPTSHPPARPLSPPLNTASVTASPANCSRRSTSLSFSCEPPCAARARASGAAAAAATHRHASLPKAATTAGASCRVGETAVEV